jgi:hypothetical protein
MPLHSSSLRTVVKPRTELGEAGEMIVVGLYGRATGRLGEVRLTFYHRAPDCTDFPAALAGSDLWTDRSRWVHRQVAAAYALGSGGTLRDTTPSMDDGGGLQWVVLHDTEA